MTKAQFLLQLAETKKGKENREVSILAWPKLDDFAIGVHTGAASGTYNTAIVNVLSNCAKSDSGDISDCLCVSTYAPTDMCKGMKDTLKVKPAFVQSGVAPPKQGKWAEDIDEPTQKAVEAVVGKAQTFDKRYMVDALKTVFTTVPTGEFPGYNACGWIDSLYMNLVMAMLGTTWNPNKGHDVSATSGNMFGGNNVAALLLEKDRIVAWGLNVMAQNKTFHAETVMLSSYLAAKNISKLPADTKVVTSLQPCHMCGGFLYHVRHDTTKIVYGMKDGDLNTVLTQNKLEGLLNLTVQAPILRAFDVPRLDGKGNEQFVVPTNSTKKGTIQDLKPNVPGPSTAVLVDTDTYKLGNAFQQFPKWLLDTRKKLADKNDKGDDKKAVNHALDLLKQVAICGMMTTYGIDLIETFFAEA
jgi:tRNA(Arg) A34 adenosine deaminase TadA